MLDNIKAVIFDLDGTLIDSMWVWKQIDIDYLGKFDAKIPEKLQSKINGMSFKEIAIYFKKAFGIEDDIETIMNEWNQMAWNKYANDVYVKDGVKKFLDKLKKDKIKLGIATSNSRPLTELVLKHNEIFDKIDYIVTSEEIEKGKPEPDIYLKVAEKLNVEPKYCLVFEDIVTGIMAGKRAGMRVCAIEDKYCKDSYEEKVSLADYYIKSFNEVI